MCRVRVRICVLRGQQFSISGLSTATQDMASNSSLELRIFKVFSTKSSLVSIFNHSDLVVFDSFDLSDDHPFGT